MIIEVFFFFPDITKKKKIIPSLKRLFNFLLPCSSDIFHSRSHHDRRQVQVGTKTWVKHSCSAVSPKHIQVQMYKHLNTVPCVQKSSWEEAEQSQSSLRRHPGPGTTQDTHWRVFQTTALLQTPSRHWWSLRNEGKLASKAPDLTTSAWMWQLPVDTPCWCPACTALNCTFLKYWNYLCH